MSESQPEFIITDGAAMIVLLQNPPKVGSSESALHHFFRSKASYVLNNLILTQSIALSLPEC